MIRSILAGLLVLAMSGCTMLDGSPAAARVSVQYATLKLIEQGDDREARARAVIALTEEAGRFLDSETATVPDVARAVLARIDLDSLTIADRMLALALVDAVTLELSERVGEGLIPGHQLLQVRSVLAWVADAASLY